MSSPTNKNDDETLVFNQTNKKPQLSVNTDFSIEENNIIESQIQIQSRDSNAYRFKTYVNGIVEIQNLQDFIIRLSVVTSLIVIGCPRFLMDQYFLYIYNHDNDTIVNIYLKVSISVQVILTIVSCYFIMSEDLDGIYNTQYDRNVIPNLIVIGKIEAFWAKYYSLLGIGIATHFYFVNGHMNAAYMYILLFGMFKFGIYRLLKNKKLL
jgi:hypothetical protein